MSYSYYLISKISKPFHAHNESVALLFDSIFVPHKHNPFDTPHGDIPLNVFMADLHAMRIAHTAIVALPIGEDCSAEVGWFHGNGKPVIAIIKDTGYGISCAEQYESLKIDWMVKGFLTEVRTDNLETFKLLKQDPILSEKTYLF